MHGIRVAGWGTALPDKTITNHDLERSLDTTDEWIRERTGISERRVGTSTTELAIEAGAKALAHSPGPVDLVLVATVSPDQATPSTASIVQDALGLTCGAIDLNAACSGFVYGLATARGFLATGMRRVLLIGAETMSKLVDWDDRGTAILFGDGAGALLLEATDGPETVLGCDMGSDGSAAGILHSAVGGNLRMDGSEVFRRAVRTMVESAETAMRRAGVTADDISLFVPHQANSRIIDSVGQRLGIPIDRTVVILECTGNTSAASIPLALGAAIEADRLQDGDLVLLVGVGAGLAWASTVVRWQT